jgi:DNA-directed RNA polymerase subunit beta
MFEISANGKVIVEEGRRITARHVRQLEEAGVRRLAVPVEYLEGKVLAHDVADPSTGEVLASANDVLTVALIERFVAANVPEIGTLYTNDLDRGPYISDTLRIDASTTRLEALIEIYRMMRPGEPPTKDAAENLFHNLFFNGERYDLHRAGVSVPRAGSHTLRHTCVQRLVDADFPFKVIGDYVGHRTPESTEIYTKVAVDTLRRVALGDGERIL